MQIAEVRLIMKGMRNLFEKDGEKIVSVAEKEVENGIKEEWCSGIIPMEMRGAQLAKWKERIAKQPILS